MRWRKKSTCSWTRKSRALRRGLSASLSFASRPLCGGRDVFFFGGAAVGVGRAVRSGTNALPAPCVGMVAAAGCGAAPSSRSIRRALGASGLGGVSLLAGRRLCLLALRVGPHRTPREPRAQHLRRDGRPRVASPLLWWPRTLPFASLRPGSHRPPHPHGAASTRNSGPGPRAEGGAKSEGDCGATSSGARGGGRLST